MLDTRRILRVRRVLAFVADMRRPWTNLPVPVPVARCPILRSLFLILRLLSLILRSLFLILRSLSLE